MNTRFCLIVLLAVATSQLFGAEPSDSPAPRTKKKPQLDEAQQSSPKSAAANREKPNLAEDKSTKTASSTKPAGSPVKGKETGSAAAKGKTGVHMCPKCLKHYTIFHTCKGTPDVKGEVAGETAQQQQDTGSESYCRMCRKKHPAGKHDVKVKDGGLGKTQRKNTGQTPVKPEAKSDKQ